MVLGEADAGLVYVSDARWASAISVIPIPDGANIVAAYPVSVLKNAARPEVAEAFVEFVT